MTYTAEIVREWGEIGFGSSKREGYSNETTFRVDGVVVDRHYYSDAAVAQYMKALFEAGYWETGPYGEVRLVDYSTDEVNHASL